MLSQFAFQATDFSSQYGSDNKISYTAGNATGKPTVYPNYGDCTESFAFRTYGPWWSGNSKDFLEFKIQKHICPYEFKIYETYNPGAVTRILAYNSDNTKWIVLWESVPENVHLISRIFSPVLSSNNFLTNTFRIEFSCSHLDYYYQIDAVEIMGSLVQFRDHSKMLAKPIQSSTAEPRRENRTDITYLPSEVFHLILSYLNLESLCRASQVSSFFKKHCYDSVLYQNLNLQLFWHRINNNALMGLITRCQCLQELNLAWCGSPNLISSSIFIHFIQKCGQNLTSLDVSNCPFLDDECLSVITNTSCLLDTLSLKNNIHESALNLSLHKIAKLKRLQYLNLYRTRVDTQSLVEIIKSCQSLEYLCLGGCYNVSNYDEVALHIGSNLSKLKVLDLWRARTLSALGIHYICNGCPDLEDLDIGWCDFIDTSSGCIQQLAVKCPKLKRLILCSIRTLSNTDLLSVSFFCHNLEQIDILGTRDITPPTVEQFLSMCGHLIMIDVSFSVQIHPNHIATWKSMFPKLSIKQSFKPLII